MGIYLRIQTWVIGLFDQSQMRYPKKISPHYWDQSVMIDIDVLF